MSFKSIGDVICKIRKYVPKKMSRSDEAILKILLAIAGKYGKWYAVPFQLTILKILKKRYDINISLRNLNYRLSYLEMNGWFDRRRRFVQDKWGRYHGRSTLFLLSLKTKRFLRGMIKQSLIWGKWFHKEFSAMLSQVEPKIRETIVADAEQLEKWKRWASQMAENHAVS